MGVEKYRILVPDQAFLNLVQIEAPKEAQSKKKNKGRLKKFKKSLKSALKQLAKEAKKIESNNPKMVDAMVESIEASALETKETFFAPIMATEYERESFEFIENITPNSKKALARLSHQFTFDKNIKTHRIKRSDPLFQQENILINYYLQNIGKTLHTVFPSSHLVFEYKNPHLGDCRDTSYGQFIYTNILEPMEKARIKYYKEMKGKFSNRRVLLDVIFNDFLVSMSERIRLNPDLMEDVKQLIQKKEELQQ